MLIPRLSSLTSQLFVPDPDIKKLFASGFRESLEIDLAWEEIDGGIPIFDAMVKTWGSLAIDPPHSLFMLIERCASYPRI